MSTRQTVSGTGSLQNVVLEFPYINQSHVKVEVGGVPLAYTWVNPTTIRFTAGAGQQVTIYRDTPNDVPLVVFGTVNSVGADDLNLATKQALFVAQEFGDVADEAVANGLTSKADLNHTHNTATSSTINATDTLNGYVAGLGVQHNINKNVFVRLEGSFTAHDDVTATDSKNTKFTADSEIIAGKLSIGYSF